MIIALISCDKEESIMQYKIDFLGGAMISSSGKTGVRTFGSSAFFKGFNKNNYPNCKSIIFMGSIAANVDPVNKIDSDTCYLELYNITDTTIIPNSTIYTISNNLVWVESGNLLDYFPDKEIDITIRLRKSEKGYMVAVNAASIYINF